MPLEASLLGNFQTATPNLLVDYYAPLLLNASLTF
jgi:hypothetical protein